MCWAVGRSIPFIFCDKKGRRGRCEAVRPGSRGDGYCLLWEGKGEEVVGIASSGRGEVKRGLGIASFWRFRLLVYWVLPHGGAREQHQRTQPFNSQGARDTQTLTALSLPASPSRTLRPDLVPHKRQPQRAKIKPPRHGRRHIKTSKRRRISAAVC